ncbi:MAG: hypothetical protein L3J70_00615 [Gammaproteobacteria bacterium]|nr:hypothetical protein [Gammaproteobacteria bacterium]
MAGEVDAVGPVWPKRPGQKTGPRKKLHDRPLKKRSGPKPEKGQKKINKSNHAIDEYV